MKPAFRLYLWSIFLLTIVPTINAQIEIIQEEIQISHPRFQSGMSPDQRSVTILTKEMIQKSTGLSLAELLQFESGIDIRRRGPNDVQTDVSIRGGNFEQVLILLNGVRMSDPQTGHHSFYLPISLSLIERIEIIKGPTSRIYGQNAFSGIINIITTEAEAHQVSIGVTSGSFGQKGTEASLQLVTENSQHLSHYSYEEGDGYRFNTDFLSRKAFHQSKFKLSEVAKINFMAGFSDRRFGANGFYANPAFINQYEEVQTSIAAVEVPLLFSNGISLKPRMSWRRNQDHYQFNRTNPLAFRNFHINNRILFELQSQIPFQHGPIGLGIELGQEYLRSNNLGRRDRRIFGLYTDWKPKLSLTSLDISLGFFLSKWSDTNFRLFPGFDLSYVLSQKSKIFLTSNLASRMPSYTDLHYTSPGERGNPLLEAERNFSTELGYKWKSSQIHLESSVYHSIGRSLIDWAKDSINQSFWQAQNIGRLNLTGAEMNVRFKPRWTSRIPWHTQFSLGLLYQDATNVSDLPSRYALDFVNFQGLIGIQQNLGLRGLSTNLRYRYLLRNSRSLDPLLDQRVIDMSLVYEIGKTRISYQIHNLSGAIYKETNLVEMPGRWHQISVSQNINLK